MLRASQAAQRRDPAPSAPVRSGQPADTANQPPRLAFAEYAGALLASRTVVARAAENDREREHDPGRERDRDDRDRDSESKLVHTLGGRPMTSACPPSNEGFEAVPRSR